MLLFVFARCVLIGYTIGLIKRASLVRHLEFDCGECDNITLSFKFYIHEAIMAKARSSRKDFSECKSVPKSIRIFYNANLTG